jgi:hypothetical protein
MTERPRLRKRPLEADAATTARADEIDIAGCASIAYSSEVARLVYEVEEATRERTQEIRVEVSEDGGRTYRQILVQEYTFSPGGATYQREDQRFTHGVTHLRLTIVPNKNGHGTATLTALRLFV